jgi:hypothetical protein
MSDLDLCIKCAKGKQTSMRKYIANRMIDVLELIRTNTCRPFPTTTRNDHVYFISFIDDYSRYDYIYLIIEIKTVCAGSLSHSIELEEDC